MGIEKWMCDDVEVGLERDMKPDIPHCSVLTFSFVDPSKTVPTTFNLPKDTGRLVVYLFDISMYKTIDHTYRVISESRRTGEPYLIGYRFYIIESKDGKTTISPELVDCISRYGKFLR
jgi:hypothetical protein